MQSRQKLMNFQHPFGQLFFRGRGVISVLEASMTGQNVGTDRAASGVLSVDLLSGSAGSVVLRGLVAERSDGELYSASCYHPVMVQ